MGFTGFTVIEEGSQRDPLRGSFKELLERLRIQCSWGLGSSVAMGFRVVVLRV